jgi:hypothetical protein
MMEEMRKKGITTIQTMNHIERDWVMVIAL